MCWLIRILNQLADQPTHVEACSRIRLAILLRSVGFEGACEVVEHAHTRVPAVRARRHTDATLRVLHRLHLQPVCFHLTA